MPKNVHKYEKTPVHDDDDEEEGVGLVSGSPVWNDNDDDDSTSSCKNYRWMIALGILVVVAAVVVLNKAQGGPTHTTAKPPTSRYPQFACPNEEVQAENFNEDFYKKAYTKVSDRLTTNLTEFLTTFRTTTYDNWGKTYNYVKEHSYDWKSKHYPPYLENGMTIYESACGIGLNLFMTLEILQETKGIEELVVYGNEYLESSAQKADLYLTQAPAKAQRGKVCTADSTHLEFVPSDSFDLVFTGYITPMLDPLKFEVGTDENYDFYQEACESTGWKGTKLNRLAQERQEDWYGTWVGEMIRIAKPGVPVIVEQVSPPFCDNYDDWGGVAKSFWKRAIDKYQWDINPHSIVMQDDDIFEDRYHVFMMKNPKNPEDV